MTKWEYKIADFETLKAEEKLNDLGTEGWEIISLYELAGQRHVRVALKRCVSMEPSLLGVG